MLSEWQVFKVNSKNWIAFRFAEQVVPKISSGGGSEIGFVIVFDPSADGSKPDSGYYNYS